MLDSAKILDLGAGTGRTYSYFNAKGYQYMGLDFLEEMKNIAYRIHGEFSYIIDDMINVKRHFTNGSLDAVFAVYSLFHLPNNELKQLFSNIYDILKINGIFLFTYQIGQGEEMVDEPYLKEKGKKVLYMSYQSNEDIKNLLNQFYFEEIFRKEKVETSDMAINANEITTAFILVKKIK